MRRRYLFPWASVCLGGMMALAGCNSGPATGDVSGTASFDGVPIEEGHITFLPADGQGGTSGGIIKDGKYEARKVPVGTMKVAITGSKVVGKKKVYPTPESPVMDVKEDFVPKKYSDVKSTELRFEVQSGKNEKNWDLKSK